MRKVVSGVVLCSVAAAGLFFWGRGDEPPATQPSRARVPLSARDALVSGDLKIGVGTQSLHGHVFDLSGPVAGATLVAVRIDEEENLADTDCEAPCGLKATECPSPEATERVAEWVNTRRGEAPPVARTTSLADGSFVLTGLLPGPHRVWSFSDKNGVAASKQVTTGAAEVEIVFGPPLPIEGTLVDGRGNPLAGRWVTAFLPAAPRYFDAQTGDDGRFSLGNLPRGEVSLFSLGPDGAVAHHRFGDATGSFSQLSRSKLILTLAAPIEQRVLVLADGKPAGGALVTRFQGTHRREWTADAEGRAQVVLPYGYPVWLSASLGNRGGTIYPEAASAPRTKAFVIELGAMDWVSGEVKNEEGAPIAGARVQAGNGLIVLTDQAGQFRIGPLAMAPGSGDRLFTASATGYLTAELTSNDPATKANFTLARASLVNGRVLSPDGLPIEGAWVGATRADDKFENTLGSQTTGPEGRFSFEDLAQGTFKLTAEHPLWGTVRREITAPVTGVDLRMEAGAEVEVTYVDEEGRPLQFEVALESDDFRVVGGRREAQTDRLGKVQFKGLAAGPYVIIPSQDHQRRSLSTFEMKPREHKALRLVLAEGAALEGRVVDAEGSPLGGLSVEARPERSGPAFAIRRPSKMFAQTEGIAEAETDAQGRFVLRHLGPGRHTVWTQGPTGKATTTALAGATGLELVLPAMLFAKGKLVDEHGAAVTHFRVNGETIDSDSGEFRVQARPHESALRIQAEGYPLLEVTLPPQAHAHVFELGTLALVPSRTVKVTVLDTQTSTPLEGAAVTASSASRVLIADARGVVSLEGVGSAEEALFVTCPGYIPEEALLPPGAEKLDVRLTRGAQLVGQVLALDGGRAYAYLRLRSSDGGFASSNPDEKGHYEVTLPPGDWELQADFGESHLKPRPEQVTLITGQTTHLDLYEPAAGIGIAVSLIDAQGEPVSMIAVLVPGAIPMPERFETVSKLMNAGHQRVLGEGRESAATPGEFTLVAATGSVDKSELYLFTERLTVTTAPHQAFTVRVPAHLTSIKRPPR